MFGKTRVQETVITIALVFGVSLLYLALTGGFTVIGCLRAAGTTACAMAVREMLVPSEKS